MLKKRTIIASLLAVLALFLSKNIWLVFKPFPVEIKLGGGGGVLHPITSL